MSLLLSDFKASDISIGDLSALLAEKTFQAAIPSHLLQKVHKGPQERV